jgi:hypothetical protein
MALQTSNLIMVGLGSLRDAPPNSEQPPLTDGIHFRWVFKRELGFPWFGFYLFRRLHQRGSLSWLSQHTGSLQKGPLTSTTLETPLAQVSSDRRLVLTEDFPPSASVEFDLADRSFLRVTFPAQELARHVETRIGFRSRPGDPPPSRKSVTFTGRSVARGPNPRTENEVVFETRDRTDRLRPNTFIRSVQTSSGPITGLGCKFKINITLPQPATFVEVTLTGAARRDRPEGTPTIEAFNQDGTRADRAAMRDPASREPETFLLSGSAITRVVIHEQQPEGQQEDDQDRVLLNELVYGITAVSEVRLTVFAATTPIHSVAIRGYAGRVVETKIEFEGISAIEFNSVPAALIDLGTVALTQDVTAGWERLKEFPYPMRLPITHPHYPCTPQMSEDFARSRQLAADRIQYGSPQQFTGPPASITGAGTISVTNGSPIVLGTGTNWNQQLLDSVFQVSGDTSVYTVVMLVSPGKLILSRNYSGTSRSGAQYVISRDAFGQFYSYLASLVTGGTAAGPMVSRTIPAPVTTVGTVSVAHESPTVTGNGTSWNSNLAGLDFQLEGEEAVYTIATVDSSTQLTLARPYASDSSSGKAYRIAARLSSSAGEMVPRMPAQSPLDMVLLGSLHPAVAQMSGLYWSDRTADVEQTYDYLIVGDYTGVAELSADKMLGVLRQNGFSNIDGSIVYNMRLAPSSPLAAPDRLEVFALPGSSRQTESEDADEATNNAGLSWNLNKTELGVLLPGRAVMYHLWRANLGNGATPAPAARYDLLSKQRPVLVVANGIPQQTAPDWPPVSLHAIDNALADGWYSYQVSGIDIFGRHTVNSAAAVWRQWVPPPEPRPWYYVDPPSDAVIHSSAIRLLTKIAPPSPTGVEAFALDPADPTLIRDAAYTTWWNGVQNKTIIGLRVRWAWPGSHQAQAPRTREFRIYYQAGHLNALLGNTRAVVAASNTESDVTTDIPNTAPADSYVGASLYAGEAFVIVASEAGGPLRVRVRNVGPRRDITPEINVPCTIAIPPVYSAGTASVFNGSTIVTGAGTAWTTQLAGMLFQPATDERAYLIASVVSETQLMLAQPYSGTSKSERVYSIRHPRFIDYSRAMNWERRYYVVNFDQHWSAGTDAQGRPLRRYEVFLPAPGDAVQEGVPLTASRTEPIVYANIGVSAADDRPHTADDPKWTGLWGGRPGNEGRVGPPAKIFRVLREPPLPPVLPRMPERMFATRADQNGNSFYTFRWKPLDETRLHVFRAFDDALFNVDWSQRPRAALDATKVEFFPSESIDARWTSVHRQQVATELNQLNAFAHDATGATQAFVYYRGLSADALRVLAGLPGNNAAFTQITIAPLDPDDPAWTNRRGPDDADNFQIGDSNNPLASPALRIFIDTLDGRTTNRYFYRVAYVDVGNNRSALSLATPPVKCPNVIPPEVPVITMAVAGMDREITLSWTSNREVDLLEYRVFRTESAQNALHIQRMDQVAVVAAEPNPATRPLAVSWTDSSVQGLKDFWYRIVAVGGDAPLSPLRGENISAASPAVKARAKQGSPAPPIIHSPVWDEARVTVTLVWQTQDPHVLARVERREFEGLPWQAVSGWLSSETQTAIDTPPPHREGWDYRIRVKDALGQQSFSQIVRTI